VGTFRLVLQIVPVPVGMETDGIIGTGTLVDDEIVGEDHIMTAVKQQCRLAAVHDIAVNGAASQIVVAVYGEDPDMLGIGITAHVMEIIVPDGVAAGGVVTACINGRGVVGNFANTIDFIVFHDMLIAGERDRHVGRIVDTVMRDDTSHSGNGDTGTVGTENFCDMMNMVIGYQIFGTGKSGSVSAGNLDTALTCMVDDGMNVDELSQKVQGEIFPMHYNLRKIWM